MRLPSSIAIAAALSLAGTARADHGHGAMEHPASGKPASTPVAPAAAGPTDPQIAHIVVTANQVDIEAGEFAKGKTTNAEVKMFAEQMVTDHGAVNRQAGDLARKLGVTPEDNATSRSLKKGGEENVANLKRLSGASFDKAYVDHEVAYHEQVLAAIDGVLVPNAKNEELKALIVKVRPAIAAHLEHAKMIQKTLAGGK